MSRYTKYKLYQKYETRGSQEAIPCYPNVFSIDGDGTMPLVIVEEQSRDCGYTGDTQPIYRWYTLPIDTYYYCDDCQTIEYRWVDMDISTYYECVGTTKYYKQKKQQTSDGGITWVDVDPPQYQMGDVYQTKSPDCGYTEAIYRWVENGYTCIGFDKYVNNIQQVSYDNGQTWQNTTNTSASTLVESDSEYCGVQHRTTSGTPYCEGYDKYVDVYYQKSYDGGSTWITASTTPTMVEHNSSDCGYVPTPKIQLSYSNGTSYSAACNDDSTLVSGETRPSGYQYSAMTSAVIGDCVTSMGGYNFSYNSNISSVTIPNSVTSIGGYAFGACYGLKRINSDTNGVFNIPTGVTSIGSSVFSGCRSLTSITIPDSVTSIGGYAFGGCSGLTNIAIPNSVTSSIGSSTFAGCSGLTSCTIGTSVSSIGSSAFTRCTSLTSCTIGSGVTSIGERAFLDCSSLTSITIPDSVTSIGNYAFYNCNYLRNVIIGSGITELGDYSFYGLRNITSITVKAVTPPTFGSYALANTGSGPIYVPSQSVSAYKSASGWRDYSSRIQAIP